MLAVAIIVLVCGGCYAAGYATRAYISRKSRKKFLMYAPYVSSPALRTPSRPPGFLIKSARPVQNLSRRLDNVG